MTLHGALDLSNYTTNVPVPGAGAAGGFITEELCKLWMQSGYSHVIIGTQWPGVAQHQIQVALRAGLTVDLYHWMYHNRDMGAYLTQRRHLVVPGVKRMWLDCEDSTQGKPQSVIVNEIDTAVTVLDSWGVELPTGIYSAAWWWPGATGNSTRFKTRPLWHAGYPTREGQAITLDQAKAMFPTWQPYGGWDKPVVWQFAGSVQQMGANLDLNVFEVAAQVPSVPTAPVLEWRWVPEGYFLTLYYGGLPVLRHGSSDGMHQGRVSRNRGGQWYWDRSDPLTGHIFQSPEEGD